jgi:DNA-binding NarL/FixJ family response regulator
MRERVLIADDNAEVRTALRFVLEHEGFSVVEVCDGVEAMDRAIEEPPDIALLDLAMPRADGLEAGRVILETSPRTRLILLTSYSRPEQIMSAFRLGFGAYVVKTDAADDLLRAIREVLAGRVFLSPAASRALMEALLPEAQADPAFQ